MRNLGDITGQSFGRLTVIKRITNYVSPSGKQRSRWLCRCSCGNNVSVVYNELSSGGTQSCGCLQRDRAGDSSRLNLTGKRFGKLLVTKYCGVKNQQTIWGCVCDCGKSIITNGHTLNSGDTLSCGCYQKERASQARKQNLIGKRFGKLTVIEDVGRTITQTVLWKCLCDCGNEIAVRSSSLLNGNTSSCGCLKESLVASELKIFCKEHLGAKLEHRVLRNPDTGKYLPFDVYIPNFRLFIEINGLQHYKYVDYFHKTNDAFKYRKKIDKLKRKYALKQGYYLEIDLRIFVSLDAAINEVVKKIQSL